MERQSLLWWVCTCDWWWERASTAQPDVYIQLHFHMQIYMYLSDILNVFVLVIRWVFHITNCFSDSDAYIYNLTFRCKDIFYSMCSFDARCSKMLLTKSKKYSRKSRRDIIEKSKEIKTILTFFISPLYSSSPQRLAPRPVTPHYPFFSFLFFV